MTDDPTFEPAPDELHNVFARYSAFRELGAGSIGKVETCFDPHLNRRIAMKTLHSGFQEDWGKRARFIREARLMAMAEHPNVVPVHELGMREDGSYYFTMKEVKGVTLADILKDLFAGKPAAEKAWPFLSLLDTFLLICNAMAFAHSKGIIHRDLKPDNVLVGDYGEVMVLDWGLAREMNDEEVFSEQESQAVPLMEDVAFGNTMDGAIMGTPDFMAPEQARGEVSEHDERSDIYALGGILYEVLTLMSPVRSLKVGDMLREISNSTITPPRQALKDVQGKVRIGGQSNVPRELDAICMKALVKDKDQRYARVEEMIKDINAWRNHLPVSVCPDSRVRKIMKWFKRHPLISTVLGSSFTVFAVVWTTLYTVDTLRYNELVREADVHRVEGSRLLRDSVVPILHWYRAGQNPADADLQKEYRKVIDSMHRDMKASYEVASVLYGRAGGRAMNERLLTANREIQVNYLKMALLLQDREEVAQRLGVIRAYAGENFERVKPESKAWLLKTVAWSESKEDVAPLSLIDFTEEELDLLLIEGWIPPENRN